LVAGVLLALVAAAAAAEGCSDCKVISLGFRHTVFCGLGAASYASNTKNFNASDFRWADMLQSHSQLKLSIQVSASYATRFKR
jgi:hypothetical protein